MSQNLPEEIFVVFLGSLGRWFLDCCHRLFPSKLKQPFMAAAHGQGHSFSSLDTFPVACGLKNEDQSPPVTPGGSFPIEAQAKYAVEVDAEFAAASSATPAPRPAISICRSPLEGPHLTPSLSTAWTDSGQCHSRAPQRHNFSGGVSILGGRDGTGEAIGRYLAGAN